MLWVFVGVIILLVVPYLIWPTLHEALVSMIDEASAFQFLLMPFGYLFIIILWVVFIYVGVSFLNNIFYKPDMQKITEIWTKESIELCSLQDNSQIEGNYFIGIGGTKENRYYEMLIENERGNKEHEKIRAEEVEINDSFPKGKTPALVTYQEHVFHCPKNEKKCCDWLSYNWDIPVEVETGEPYKVLEVPAGTVSTEYSIDLKD